MKRRDEYADPKVDITLSEPRSVRTNRLLVDIAKAGGGDVKKAATGDPPSARTGGPVPRKAAAK